MYPLTTTLSPVLGHHPLLVQIIIITRLRYFILRVCFCEHYNLNISPFFKKIFDKPHSKCHFSRLKSKRNLDSAGMSLKSYGSPPQPTHPPLLSMKEVSNNKTQRVKVAQYNPSTCSAQKVGQQEGEERWVQHVQEEYYQRNVLW